MGLDSHNLIDWLIDWFEYFYWEAKNEQVPEWCCFCMGVWDHPSRITCRQEGYWKTVGQMQPGFAKPPCRKNIAVVVKTSRGAMEQSRQGWSSDAKSSHTAVFPATRADLPQGLAAGGELFLQPWAKCIWATKEKVPACLTGCFLLVLSDLLTTFSLSGMWPCSDLLLL